MSRFDVVTSAFLRYLYQGERFRPSVTAFFDSAHADMEPPVTIDELHRVMTALVHQELIATGDPDPETGIPARAGLTGAGLICVDHYDGDVEQWVGIPASSLPRDCRPHDAQLCDAPRSDTQSSGAQRSGPQPSGEKIVAPRSAPDQDEEQRHALTGLVRVARVLLLTLPSVHTANNPATGVQQAANQLLELAHAPKPDAWEVRQIAQKLRDELATGPVANTLGVVLLDGLDDALRETDLQLATPDSHVR